MDRTTWLAAGCFVCSVQSLVLPCPPRTQSPAGIWLPQASSVLLAVVMEDASGSQAVVQLCVCLCVGTRYSWAEEVTRRAAAIPVTEYGLHLYSRQSASVQQFHYWWRMMDMEPCLIAPLKYLALALCLF